METQLMNILKSYVKPFLKKGFLIQNLFDHVITAQQGISNGKEYWTVCSLRLYHSKLPPPENDHFETVNPFNKVYVALAYNNGVLGIDLETFGQFDELDDFTSIPIDDPDSYKKVSDFIIEHYVRRFKGKWNG